LHLQIPDKYSGLSDDSRGAFCWIMSHFFSILRVEAEKSSEPIMQFLKNCFSERFQAPLTQSLRRLENTVLRDAFHCVKLSLNQSEN
jgi:hypothetical protein